MLTFIFAQFEKYFYLKGHLGKCVTKKHDTTTNHNMRQAVLWTNLCCTFILTKEWIGLVSKHRCISHAGARPCCSGDNRRWLSRDTEQWWSKCGVSRAALHLSQQDVLLDGSLFGAALCHAQPQAMTEQISLHTSCTAQRSQDNPSVQRKTTLRITPLPLNMQVF